MFSCVGLRLRWAVSECNGSSELGAFRRGSAVTEGIGEFSCGAFCIGSRGQFG